MKHEHDEIFASLRAELNLQLDDNMASYIASEPRAKIVDGAESAKGRAFAAEIARNHGVAGVRSLHRCLSDVGIPFDEDDAAADAALREQLKGKSKSFTIGAEAFCELSGVLQ
jgi:hypothetical protein